MRRDAILNNTTDLQQPTVDVRIEPIGPEAVDILQPLAWKIFEDTFGPHNQEAVLKSYMDKWLSKAQLSIELAEPENHFALVSVLDPCTPEMPKPETSIAVGYFKLVDYPKSDAALPDVIRPYQSIKLQRFYVDESCQGKGVAHRMMEACLEKADALKKEAMWLGVWEHNHRAIRFYEKWDFKTVGCQPFILGGDDPDHQDSQMDNWMLRLL